MGLDASRRKNILPGCSALICSCRTRPQDLFLEFIGIATPVFGAGAMFFLFK